MHSKNEKFEFKNRLLCHPLLSGTKTTRFQCLSHFSQSTCYNCVNTGTFSQYKVLKSFQAQTLSISGTDQILKLLFCFIFPGCCFCYSLYSSPSVSHCFSVTCLSHYFLVLVVVLAPKLSILFTSTAPLSLPDEALLRHFSCRCLFIFIPLFFCLFFN